MGVPKGLLDVDGVPLICLHVAAFHAVGLPVVVVLGAHAEQYAAVLREKAAPLFRLVLNAAWATTAMADSLRLGQGLGAALVTPVDVPPARRTTLQALLAESGDAVPEYGGEPGHPVLLARPLLEGERLDVRLGSARRVRIDDPDCLLNLNTPADWASWHAR